MKPKPYATEADLCAAFIGWIGRVQPDMKVYAEWAGWDILLVYPEGWQIGVQAKLRLNATVMLQAAPDRWYDGTHNGPDYRAILVPDHNGWAEVASRLGLVVFAPYASYRDSPEFKPDLRERWPRYGTWVRTAANAVDPEWCDWNPATRHALPPVATDAIAGSPCPVSLTTWKLCAIDVLAELETVGTITTKRMRELGVNPARWTQNFWLMPGDKRGIWTRGEKCPPFDTQHPTAFAAALEKARAKVSTVSATA